MVGGGGGGVTERNFTKSVTRERKERELFIELITISENRVTKHGKGSWDV